MSLVNFNGFSNYSNYSQTNQLPKQDPNAYAQEYANQNGITLEEAKTKLSTMFGDPTQGTQLPGTDQQSQTSSIFSQNSIGSVNNIGNNIGISSVESSNSSNSNSLMNLWHLLRPGNENEDRPSPEDVLKQYMEENNLDINNEEDVKQAKAELSATFGDPEQTQS